MSSQIPFTEFPQFLLKPIKPDLKWSDTIERIQFNFDQIYAFGGGRPGKIGDQGDQGIPGATGNAITGGKGDKGSIIWYENTPLLPDGAYVSTLLHPNYREFDTIINQANGDYFTLYLDSNSDLRYKFELNLSALSLGTYIQSENGYYSGGTTANSIDHIIVDHGVGSYERNLVFVRRTGTTPNYTSEYFRILVGMDKFLGSSDITAAFCNIPSNAGTNTDPVLDPGQADFHQFALKFRPSRLLPPTLNSFLGKYWETGTYYNARFKNSDVSIDFYKDLTNPDLNKIITTAKTLRHVGNVADPLLAINWVDIIVSATDNYFESQTNLTTNVNGIYNINVVGGATQSIHTYNGLGLWEIVYGKKITSLDEWVLGQLIAGDQKWTMACDVEVRNLTIGMFTMDNLFSYAVKTYFKNKFALKSTNIFLGGGSIAFDLSLAVGSKYYITASGVDASTITSFTNGITDQIFTLYIKNNITIRNSATLDLSACKQVLNNNLRLNIGESLTFQLKGAVYTLVEWSFRDAPRRFYGVDITNNINNLTIEGFWFHYDFNVTGPTTTNYSPILQHKLATVYSGSLFTITTRVTIAGDNPLVVLQEQSDFSLWYDNEASNAFPSDLEVETYTRRRAINFLAMPVWTAWFSHTFGNKVNDWKALQRLQESQTLVETGVSGNFWTPTWDGNQFIFGGAADLTINEISDIGFELNSPTSYNKGAEITIYNGSFSGKILTLDFTAVPSNPPHGRRIFCVPLMDRGIDNIQVYPNHTVKLKLTSFIFGIGIYLVTEYSSFLSKKVDTQVFNYSPLVISSTIFAVYPGLTYTLPNDGAQRWIKIDFKVKHSTGALPNVYVANNYIIRVGGVDVEYGTFGKGQNVVTWQMTGEYIFLTCLQKANPGDIVEVLVRKDPSAGSNLSVDTAIMIIMESK